MAVGEALVSAQAWQDPAEQGAAVLRPVAAVVVALLTCQGRLVARRAALLS